jgi:paraquat-inducible protein B
MTIPQKPIVQKNKGISIIWILPIIALSICAWLLYSSYKNAGVDITIYFNDASGIVPGKTQVMVKGIPIGLVKKVEPDLAEKRIKATIEMDHAVEEYLVEDTLFWIVRPQLSASSIQGLDTIFSGSYISAQAGTSTAPKRKYTGLAAPPPISAQAPGLHLQLRADMLGSIQVGTGIYYRNIKIGGVQAHRLEEDDSILIDIFVENEFSHLVREGSRFSNASGIQISGKLPSVKIQIESLAALLRGGILLHTPESLQETPQVANHHIFPLFKDYESANYGIPMTLTLASGHDIVEGSTRVMYRGLEAGYVKEIAINKDERRTVTAHILLDPRAELILKENTKFWLEKTEISPIGLKNVGLLLSGAHITFQPGDGEFKDHFEILPDPPSQLPLRAGKSFVLLSNGPVSISTKSPVYFKNIQVGEVVEIDLEKTGRAIRTTFFIYEKHLHLLSTKSVFWIHSGVDVKVNVQEGIELATGPIASILSGGISFTTPDKLNRKKNFTPKEGFEYSLYKNFRDAANNTPALKETGRTVTLISADARSLSLGAPILHKNIKIGKIIALRLSPDRNNVLVQTLIAEEFKDLISKQTRFYNLSGIELSGGLSGLEVQAGSLLSIVAGGVGCLTLPEVAPHDPAKPFFLYTNLEGALDADDFDIRIQFQATNGLKIGSQIRYKGVNIGKITTLDLDKDLTTIISSARIYFKTETLFRENTKLWIAEAEINLGGIKNPQTILFGSYINILPGDGPPKRAFTVEEEPPRTEIANSLGLGIVLQTPHLGSLTPGSPIYYREVQVGEVSGYELSPTFQRVHVFVSIYKP